jgi:hypothetical protein
MRQLVSALELRFQALESESDSLFNLDTTGDLDDRYSQIGHTHTESEITDLGSYITNLNNESIFDLSDVSGTPAPDDVLVWDGAAFTPQSASGTSVALDDLTDVDVPAPNDLDVLRYNDTTQQWEAAASSTVTSFVDLSDTDLSGQAIYDMVFNATGTEWQDTNGELIWRPDLDYLQLANAHSINWLDVGDASTELLQFEEVGVASVELTHEIVQTETTYTATAGGGWENVTGATLTGASQNSGNDILLFGDIRINGTISSTLNDREVRLHDGTGVVTYSDARIEDEVDATHGHHSGFMRKMTAGGGKDYHWEINAGATQNVNCYSTQLLAMDLTEIGASNYKYSEDTTGVTDMTGANWTSSAASVTFGDGVKNWLVFWCMQRNIDDQGRRYAVRLNDGSSPVILFQDESEDAVEVRTAAGFFTMAAPASATWTVEVQGESGFNNDDLLFASVCAIDLDTFEDHAVEANTTNKADWDSNPGVAVTDTHTTATAATADWACFGYYSASDWNAASNWADSYLEVDDDGGGYTELTRPAIYDKHGYYTTHDGGSTTHNCFMGTASSVANGSSLTARVGHTAGDVNHESNRHTMAMFTWNITSSLVETFIVGDPSFTTQIDGSQVDVTSNVDLLTGSDLTIWDATDTDKAVFSHDGTDFNADFTGTLDWNISGLTNLTIVHATQPGLDFEGTTARIRHSGNNFISASSSTVNVGVPAQPAIFQVKPTTIRMLDAGLTDFADFSHDGTNFNIVGTNTSRFQFEGTGLLSVDINGTDGADLRVLEGGAFYVYDSTNIDYASFSHDGTDFLTTFTNTTDWKISGLTGQLTLQGGVDLDVQAGGHVMIRDTLNTDYGQLWHDGANFNFTFVNTTVADFTGASIYQFDNDVHVKTGGYLTVYDSTNLEYIRVVPSATQFDIQATQHIQIAPDGHDLLLFDSGGTAGFRIYDSTGVDYSRWTHDGTDFNLVLTGTTDYNISGHTGALRVGSNFVVNDGTNLVTIKGGYETRFVDSTGSDYAALSHDGTDFNHAFVNTTWLRFKSLTSGVLFQDGADVRIYDSTDADYLSMLHDGTNALVSTNTGSINFTPSARVNILAGKPLWIYDPTTTDYAAFQHDGTDFVTDFVTTTEWAIGQSSPDVNVHFYDGATSAFYIRNSDNRVEVRSGRTLRILNSANADYAELSHDGTDFNLTCFQTTDWNISGADVVMDGGLTVTGNTLDIEGLSARLRMEETDGSLNNKEWEFLTSGEVFQFSILSDDLLTRTAVYQVQRTGTTVDSVDFAAPITATSYDGVLAANVIDKTGNEVVSGSWIFEATSGATFTRWRKATATDTVQLQFEQEAGLDRFIIALAGTTDDDFNLWAYTDAGAFSHTAMKIDGVDFSIDFNSFGGPFNFVAANFVNVRDGAGMRIYDSGDTDFALFKHNGTDFNLSFTGTTDFNIGTDGAAGAEIVKVWADLHVRDGQAFRIWDDTENDYGQFSHDGTDFNTTFTNTAAWNITGLTNFDVVGNIRVQTGGDLYIFDSGNTDYGQFSHDGDDFNTALTNTTDWNVTGARLVLEAYTEPSEVVTTTNVITAAESGTTYYLNAAGGFTSTLPAPAEGLRYRFIVSTAPTTAYIITTNAGANILYGTINEITTTAGISIQAQDTLNFVASTSLVGDWIEAESDGTNWYIHGVTQVDNGITVSVT